MAEQWSELETEASSEAMKNGSLDGAVATEDAPPTGEHDADAPEAATEDDIRADATATLDEAAADGGADVTAETESVVDTDQSATIASGDVATDSAPDEGSAFLAELARAMQATAAAERLKVDAEIEQRRSGHIDNISARQTAEADRMRELAAEELTSIDAWADGEIERIRQERERRAAALDEDLATSLAEHTSQIEAEIARVEGAIASYRADVDAFFAQLDKETDVVVIAQRATQRPAFPDLSVAAAGTPTTEETTTDALAAPASDAPEASAEPTSIGVMDPTSVGAPAEPWATDAATAEPNATLEPSDPDETDAEPTLLDDDAVAVGVEPGRKSLFQSVQVVHPTSWLRHRNGDDGPSGD